MREPSVCPILTLPFCPKPGRCEALASQVMRPAHTRPKCEAASEFPHCINDIVKE
jgi:hypothetical protein